MEKNCKSCKNFFTCDLSKFLPFPENGCSEFVSAIKENRLFAIFFHNSQTGHAKVINIFDDEKLALAELNEIRESIFKRSSSCIHVYIRPCSLSYSKTLADDILMTIVNCVAQDLLIAERGFKKGCFKQETFVKSARWFKFAHIACRRGAAILDIVNHD